MIVTEQFSNIIKLKERIYQGSPKYKFNTRIRRNEIETFGKAFGISLSESHIQFLENFNGGLIQEYEDAYYIDMTEWEPDGPKWSSFSLFSLNEIIEQYRSLKLDNWLLDENFEGNYPIIPICSTPGSVDNILFMVSNKGLSKESPIFSCVKEKEAFRCTKIATDFNTFLGYYLESEGFPALLPDDIEPSWNNFMLKNKVIEIASGEETFPESIARCTAHLKLFPKNEWAYCERGTFYGFNNQIKKALKDINKAIDIDEKIGFFYYCRGELILENGNPRVALIDLDIAVNLEPDKAMFRISRANAFLKLNKFKKALLDCNKVLEANRTDIFGLQTRIKVYNALGKQEKAANDKEILNSIKY